jgi:hypothetical protein
MKFSPSLPQGEGAKDNWIGTLIEEVKIWIETLIVAVFTPSPWERDGVRL